VDSIPGLRGREIGFIIKRSTHADIVISAIPAIMPTKKRGIGNFIDDGRPRRYHAVLNAQVGTPSYAITQRSRSSDTLCRLAHRAFSFVPMPATIASLGHPRHQWSG
jgi:hypothetical protein